MANPDVRTAENQMCSVKTAAASLCIFTCRGRGDDRCMCVHIFNEVFGHSLQLLHFSHIQRNTSTLVRNWARGWRLLVHTHRTQTNPLGPPVSTTHYLHDCQTIPFLVLLCKQCKECFHVSKATTYSWGRGSFHRLIKRGVGRCHRLGLRRRHSSGRVLFCFHLTDKRRTLYVI